MREVICVMSLLVVTMFRKELTSASRDGQRNRAVGHLVHSNAVCVGAVERLAEPVAHGHALERRPDDEAKCIVSRFIRRFCASDPDGSNRASK